MANTYVDYTGDGSQDTFSISFPYLSTTHVSVLVATVAQTEGTHYNITTGSVVFTVGNVPASAAAIRIKRVTEKVTPLVDFKDGSTLLEADLDTSSRQSFYISQETDEAAFQADGDGNYDASTNKLVNVGTPTAGTDGATKQYVDDQILTKDNLDEIAEGTTNKHLTSTLKTKLDGIEASADVTDATNVEAAGALMDSEVDADLKTLSLPASTTISDFGKTVVDDADAAAARTTLGVDPSGTDNSTDVTLANTNYLSLSGQEVTGGTVPLGSGGTGQASAQASINALTGASSSITDNHVLTKDSSDNAVWAAAPGASGGEANTGSNVGTGEGTVFKQKTGTDLEFKKLAEGSNITVTDSGTEITIAATSGGGDTLPIVDSTAVVKDPVDATKLARIDAGAITTGTTRVITMGDRDVDLASSGTFAESAHNHDSSYSATGHNHSGVYEPADATIVKDADIGSTVQAFDATIMVDADIGVSVQAFDTDTAKTDVTQSFSAPQQGTVDSTQASTGVCDLSEANNHSVAVSGATQVSYSNAVAGQSGTITITHDDATTITFSGWKWEGGTVPTPSTSGVDLIAYYCESSTRVSAVYLKGMA